MGKSVKKNPVVTDNAHSHAGKKRASKKVRQALKNSDELLNGNLYKRVTESWEISDYSFRLTKAEAIELYYRYIAEEALYGSTWTLDKYPTEQDFLNWWASCYERK